LFCLIAAENDVAQVIKTELNKCYPDWKFDTCTDAQALSRYSDEVNVLVLSRFLPEDSFKLLKELKLMFFSTHIVLLVGVDGEHQRAYIKAAEDNGLFNIVTGTLPGDMPYDIFTAVKTPKHPDREGYIDVEEYFQEKDDEENDELINLHPEEILTEPDIDDTPAPVEDDQPRDNDNVEDLKTKINELEQIVKMLNTGEQEKTPMSKMAKGGGILVLSAANRGGVGKTTVAVTVAEALSRAGVPTVLIDYDLGSPAVANFLEIKDVSGIEALAGRTIRHSNLQDIIVEKGNLNILPGVMNRTLPKFKEGQLWQIIDMLKEMYGVVVCDTPPEHWTKPWITELFKKADYVFAVVDQSKTSEENTRAYAPYLLTMGASPERIGIVLNKYSPKLDHPKKVEKEFCAGFKKNVKTLPKIAAVIPEDWDAHVSKGYKGEVVGLEDINSQWHRLAERIAQLAGYGYKQSSKKEKKSIKDLISGIKKISFKKS